MPDIKFIFVKHGFNGTSKTNSLYIEYCVLQAINREYLFLSKMFLFHERVSKENLYSWVTYAFNGNINLLCTQMKYRTIRHRVEQYI